MQEQRLQNGKSINAGLMEDSFASIASSMMSDLSSNEENNSEKQKSTIQIMKEKVDGHYRTDGYIGQQLLMNRNYIESLKERPTLYLYQKKVVKASKQEQRNEKKHKEPLAPLRLRKFFRDNR